MCGYLYAILVIFIILLFWGNFELKFLSAIGLVCTAIVLSRSTKLHKILNESKMGKTPYPTADTFINIMEGKL